MWTRWLTLWMSVGIFIQTLFNRLIYQVTIVARMESMHWYNNTKVYLANTTDDYPKFQSQKPAASTIPLGDRSHFTLGGTFPKDSPLHSKPPQILATLTSAALLLSTFLESFSLQHFLMKIKSGQSWFSSILPFLRYPESIQQRTGKPSRQWQILFSG